MTRRLLLAALAVTSLTACGGKPAGPRTVLVEREGRYAIAVQNGKSIQFFPLPAQAYTMADGTFTPLSPSTQIGVIPKCPCSVPDCSIYCMPRSAWWTEPPLSVDPTPRQPPAP
jgi:hypothetical protein